MSQKQGLLNGIGSSVQRAQAYAPGTDAANIGAQSILSERPKNIASYAQNPCQAELSNWHVCLKINESESHCAPFANMLKTCKINHNIV